MSKDPRNYRSKYRQSDVGKGDARRPSEVSDEQYARNWDRIFQGSPRGEEAEDGAGEE